MKELATKYDDLLKENAILKDKIRKYESDVLMPEKNQQINALTNELEDLYKSLIYIPEIHTKAQWQFKIYSNESMLRKMHFWENDRRERYEEQIEGYKKELAKVEASIRYTEETIKQRIKNVEDEIDQLKNELQDLLIKESEKSEAEKAEALEQLPALRFALAKNIADINLIDYETITMGSYYFDSPIRDIKRTELFSPTKNPLKNNTISAKDLEKKPVEWIVLEKQPDKMFVISKYCIDCHRFNSKHREFSWENSDIRKWLNAELIYDLFNEEEISHILTTTVITGPNKVFGTPGGSDTEDRLFFLSLDESRHYFYANNNRSALPTPYTKAKGVFEYGGTCWWWLRSPGANKTFAADIDVTGGPSPLGDFGISFLQGIRPAMWISI